MKAYVQEFIQEGLAYRGKKYDFLLLKDLVEFARRTDLNIKIRDLKSALEDEGWLHKKASVLTDNGYQSKDIWFINGRVDEAQETPIITKMRENLAQAEFVEAERMILKIFTECESLQERPEVFVNETEIVYTNKGLKNVLVELTAKGSISKISSIIRGWSNKVLVGEHFFGTSSRTILFKNYYKLNKAELNEKI